jgi:hypothetical protein
MNHTARRCARVQAGGIEGRQVPVVAVPHRPFAGTVVRHVAREQLASEPDHETEANENTKNSVVKQRMK